MIVFGSSHAEPLGTGPVISARFLALLLAPLLWASVRFGPASTSFSLLSHGPHAPVGRDARRGPAVGSASPGRSARLPDRAGCRRGAPHVPGGPDAGAPEGGGARPRTARVRAAALAPVHRIRASRQPRDGGDVREMGRAHRRELRRRPLPGPADARRGGRGDRLLLGGARRRPASWRERQGRLSGRDAGSPARPALRDRADPGEWRRERSSRMARSGRPEPDRPVAGRRRNHRGRVAHAPLGPGLARGAHPAGTAGRRRAGRRPGAEGNGGRAAARARR